MRIIWLIAALLLGGGGVSAQPSLLRSYATQRVNQRLEKQYPEVAETRRAIEQYIKDFQQKGSFKKAVIPVVVHLLVGPGVELPSEAQVYAQLEALNGDFDREEAIAKHPADTLEGFLRKAARSQIEFCLPQQGPDGRPAAAIRYVSTSVQEWDDDDAIKSAALGGADAWDPARYLNVWVGRLKEGLSGYAQLPGGPAASDGIVIDYRFFGVGGPTRPPYDQGRTLTHLVGGYLNLYELWNEREPCGDDYVDDTPVHNEPNYGGAMYKHVSTCHDNPVEMTMNFMDNSDDSTLYMFTIGQKVRMQAVLSEAGPRGGLLSEKTKCEKPARENPLVEGREEPGSSGEESSSQQQPPQLFIRPNPAVNAFTLDILTQESGELKLTIYNTLGAVVFVRNQLFAGGPHQLEIDCSRWAGGVYMVSLLINGYRATQRLVVPQN